LETGANKEQLFQSSFSQRSSEFAAKILRINAHFVDQITIICYLPRRLVPPEPCVKTEAL